MTDEKIDVLHAVTSSLSLVLMRGQLGYLRRVGFRAAAVCGAGVEVENTCTLEAAPIITIAMAREVSPLRDLVSLVRIWRLLRRVRPQICNAGTPKAGLLVGVAGWLVRTPCRVYTLRGLRLETTKGIKRTILHLTERIACACAHRVICVSPSLRRRALELRLVAPEKALVLASGSSNGVDPGRFASTAEGLLAAAKIRLQHGIAPTARVIGYVGRITQDKGVPELLAAFRMVKEHLFDAVLMVVGGYEAGDPVSQETRDAIDHDDAVVHIEFAPDTAPYYLVMDVLVLPTHREGFPNTVLEAQAAERPVVTTYATGAIDSISPGVTGVLVFVGDVKALAEAMIQMLFDRERAQRMGRAGRERVCQEFRQERVWKALADLYCELLHERGLPIPSGYMPEAAPTCSDTR